MIKTPSNRLLDLTYGWYQFVEAAASREEEPLMDDRLPSQELLISTRLPERKPAKNKKTAAVRPAQRPKSAPL